MFKENKRELSYKGMKFEMERPFLNANLLINGKIPETGNDVNFYAFFEDREAQTPEELAFLVKYNLRADFMFFNGESGWIALEKDMVEDDDILIDKKHRGFFVKKKNGDYVKVPDAPIAAPTGKGECPRCRKITTYSIKKVPQYACIENESKNIEVLDGVCDVCGCPGVYAPGIPTLSFIDFCEAKRKAFNLATAEELKDVMDALNFTAEQFAYVCDRKLEEIEDVLNGGLPTSGLTEQIRYTKKKIENGEI